MPTLRGSLHTVSAFLSGRMSRLDSIFLHWEILFLVPLPGFSRHNSGGEFPVKAALCDPILGGAGAARV